MKLVVALAGTLWLLTSILGFAWLNGYEATPAQETDDYPSSFPAESELQHPQTKPVLIFFAHPKCPCTRASLRELSRLMTDTGGRMQINIVFDLPDGADESFADTDLRSFAEELPDANVIIDRDERETHVFRADTSGLVLLYDSNGSLRFHGGITSARGHEGDSAGRNAIFGIVTGDPMNVEKTAVFGCPLHKRDCRGEIIDVPAR